MDERKAQLIGSVVSHFVAPAAVKAVDTHYQKKIMHQQEEMAIRVAEKRAEVMGQMGGQEQSRTVQTPSGGPEEVYAQLRDFKESVDCSFCRQAATELLDAPPEDARRGLGELQSYKDEVDRVEGSDISEEEAQAVVSELVGQWTVVPEYISP